MRPQEESGRPPTWTVYGATTAARLSRASKFTLQVFALGACILAPLAAVAGLSYAVDRAPQQTIPLIILACLLFVGRVLYLEVTR